MNGDFRLSVGLFQHPKFVKLRRRLGTDAALAFIQVLAFTAQHRPNGSLSGMDADDIAIAGQYDGDAPAFVSALVDLRLIDETEQGYVVHDWHEHNPWAAGAPARSEKAKAAADARWGKQREGVPDDGRVDGGAMPPPTDEDAPALPVQEELPLSQCTEHATGMRQASASNAPLLSSPSPSQDGDTPRESHGPLAGARDGLPPQGDPFDNRPDWQQDETTARQEAGRRNKPITDLFVAFRRGKWPHKPAEWHETYPTAELREAFETLRALHQDGVTPEQMQKATERCLVEYSKPERVTVDAIARAWTTLTEPPSKVIGGKPPGSPQVPANGQQQQQAPRSARRLVQ